MVSNEDRIHSVPTGREFLLFTNTGADAAYLGIEYSTGWGGKLNNTDVATINGVEVKSVNAIE